MYESKIEKENYSRKSSHFDGSWFTNKMLAVNGEPVNCERIPC